jgi:hypothetical protein
MLLLLLIMLQVCDARKSGMCPRFQATFSGGKLKPSYLGAFRTQCNGGCVATVVFKSPFDTAGCDSSPVSFVSLTVGGKFTQCAKATNVNFGQEVTLVNVAHGSVVYAYVYDPSFTANTVSPAVVFKELGRPSCRVGSGSGFCGRYGGFTVNCGTNCRRN